MVLGNLQELLRGAGWLAAALLPLFQGTLRHAQSCGKIRLRESALYPHTDDVRLGFNSLPFSAPGFDLPYTVQDFLPDIAFGFESGEGLTCKLFTLVEMPLLKKRFEPALRHDGSRRFHWARCFRPVLLERIVRWGINGDEFGNQSFWSNVLLVRPCHSTQDHAHLLEIVRIA